MNWGGGYGEAGGGEKTPQKPCFRALKRVSGDGAGDPMGTAGKGTSTSIWAGGRIDIEAGFVPSSMFHSPPGSPTFENMK